jgi:ABC-type uncharacterized transport system involved in gliding motility auxiliary subunit
LKTDNPDMRLSNSKKVSIAFALSVLLLIGVGAYCYVELSVDLLSMALLLAGGLSLIFCVSYSIKSRHNSVGALEWKRVAVFSTVLLLSIVFLIGVNYLAHQLPQRWDLTRDKQHTLNQSTIDFVKGIDKPTELTAFYVGLPPKYLEDLLNEYERVSNGNISVNIIDPIEDIASAAKFGNLISGQEKKLIVVSGAERKDVDFTEASLSEGQVTNALARVVRERRKAYFLTGHGEYSASNENNEGLSLFAELLSSNNISSNSLMLGVAEKIPEDCDVLIIAGPSTDLTDQEQALIVGYLEQGGDALFLIESIAITRPDVPLTAEQVGKNPSLNSILNLWGMNVGTDIVVDLSSHVGGDVGSPATRNYIDHKAITEGLDYTFYIRPRSIAELANRRETIKLAPIVLSANQQQSWAETNRTLKVDFDEGIDTPGPVPISYVAWEEKTTDDESDTRIIAFTDADFVSNAYLNQYSNAAMAINVVNWLSELDYAVIVNQKSEQVERLDLTSKQTRMIAVILLLMPLLIALAGLFVWVRR